MTLVEVLVALMIFSVVGGAMVGILLISTNIYRRGEFGRSANDESIAVLSAMDADLDRLVPRSAGGWLYARVVDPSGDCLIAFTIRADETVRVDLATTAGTGTQQVVSDTGAGARQVVVWWTTVQGSVRELRRQALPWDGTSDPQTEIYEKVRVFADWDNAARSGPILWTPGTNVPTFPYTVVTRGCIHLGAWLSFDGSDPTNFPRRESPNGVPNWEIATSSGLQLRPRADGIPYDSNPLDPLTPAPPWPQALRISVGLTGGGKFAPTGRVISDTGTQLRVVGLDGQAVSAGVALVRVGPEALSGEGEWILCSSVQGSLLNCDATGRGARRSEQTTHGRGEIVEVGRQFSMVRTLGR